jgi:hypothetical protein
LSPGLRTLDARDIDLKGLSFDPGKSSEPFMQSTWYSAAKPEQTVNNTKIRAVTSRMLMSGLLSEHFNDLETYIFYPTTPAIVLNQAHEKYSP